MKNRQADRESVWTATDAWVCVLSLIAAVFGIRGLLWIGAQADPAVARWFGTFYFRAGFRLFMVGLLVVFAFWCSRARSIREFLSNAGLRGRPSLFGWWSAWLAIGISLLEVYGIARGWAPRDEHYRAFYNKGGEGLSFLAVWGVVLVPFSEEVLMRGFLYRAFRRSYGKSLSTFLILSLDTFSHWSHVSHSIFVFACMALGIILLCQLLERTGNLWNCVIFHAAHDATGFLHWQFSVIGVILFFPICARCESNH